MWIMKDELLHTESCSGKILLNEIQLTQFLPSLLVTHEPETDGHISKVILCLYSVAYPGILFGGGVQQIQLRTEDRENRDLWAVAP